MRCRQVLHDGDELPPLPAAALKLFQLARQPHRSIGLLAIQETPHQSNYLLHPRRIRLKKLPHQRFGIGVAARRHQRIGVGLAQCRRNFSGVHLRLKNEDSRTHLSLCQQALCIGQDDALIRSILLIGALVPLRRIAARGRRQQRHPLIRGCRRFAISQLRGEFCGP